MTDNKSEAERTELLERICLAEAKALVTILEETPAQELNAATLNSARQFLRDQGVRLDTLNKYKRRVAGGGYADKIAAAVKADERAPLPELD